MEGFGLCLVSNVHRIIVSSDEADGRGNSGHTSLQDDSKENSLSAVTKQVAMTKIEEIVYKDTEDC